MFCPKCGKENVETAAFCAGCGSPLRRAASVPGTSSGLKGSLTRDGAAPVGGRQHRSGSVKISASPTAADPAPRQTSAEIFSFCPRCGRRLRQGESCPVCAGYATAPAATGLVGGKKSKTWIWIAASVAVVLVAVGIAAAALLPGKTANVLSVPAEERSSASVTLPAGRETEAPVSSGEPLSLSCDYVLCIGMDNDGNLYELVANQTESSRGFEITVGVIKNDEWLYPLSSDFPFLAEDGLFHVSVPMGKSSGTSLQSPNMVIDSLYFIDTGAFLMDSYQDNDSWTLHDHYYIVFSCDTLQSTRINCDETETVFWHEDASFMNGQVEYYGSIRTDNGKLIQYTETSGTISGWVEDQTFVWETFDTRTLKTAVVASGVEGVRPSGPLAEGLYFCTNKGFYNTAGQRVIDLSCYSIDMSTNGDAYFENGICTIEVKNDLGTRFWVTVDSAGNILEERPVS